MNDYRADFPFEYCALRFLLQWLHAERALYQAIASNPSDEDISNALAYFQVSRNFKGISKEPEKVTFIRKALISVCKGKTLSPEEKVEKLTRRLESEFKKFNLSAASKLLWLSFREPFVIYDSRAVNALSKKLGRKFGRRDYAAYSAAWRSEYAAVESAIECAASRLPMGRIFMPSCSLTNRELLQLAKMPWFKERVFDIFLWELGGDR